MKRIIISSLNRKEGKTTAAVNIMSGLMRCGLSIDLLDLGAAADATQWIHKTPALSDIVTTHDIAWLDTHTEEMRSPDHGKPICLVDLDRHCRMADNLLVQEAIALLIVKIDGGRTDFGEMAAWDTGLTELRGHGFDLIVPFQYDAREWEKNDHFLEALVSCFDWERIANPAPT